MSILNVNTIQPVGSAQTVTVSATDLKIGTTTLSSGGSGVFVGNLTGNVTGNINSSGVSTVTTLQGSSNTISIPTGHRVVGVDTGSVYAPGMLLQRQVKVFTAEVQLAQQSHLTIFTSDTFNLRRASSRVYITVIAHHGKRASGEHQFSVRALRNGTIVTQNMSSADAVTFDVERGPDTANAALHELTPFAFYDEPNTTGNLTYVFAAARPNAGYPTVFFNFGGNTGRSVMILEEIAQ